MKHSELCVAAAIIVIAVSLAAVPAALAETQGSGGLVYETSDDGTASVVGYTGDPVSVYIPEVVSLDGSEYRVTSIGDEAFARCTSLVSVDILDTVEGFGAMAFAECPSLQSLRIPDGVSVIPESVFQGCQSLDGVVLPGSIEGISAGAFNGCESLTSIHIPDSVTFLGREAFMDCSSLREVTGMGGVTENRGLCSRDAPRWDHSPSNRAWNS